MTQFIPNITPEPLTDKVILITGGSNGIGASFVELCCQNGAYVCFGDVADAAGHGHAEKLCASYPSSSPKPRAIFNHTDVSDYSSIVGLFDAALATYGCIDHVVAAAAIQEIGNWFDPDLTLEDVRKVGSEVHFHGNYYYMEKVNWLIENEQPATDKVLDINLRGVLYVARIASVYLRQNRPENADRSITLISSVAGFKESPGLFVYQATKHGVLGAMRALRQYLPRQAHRLRVNAVCPWMTTTGMVKGIQDAWFKAELPANTPTAVARIIAGLVVDPKLNGTSMYVEGGRGWEIEENLDRLESQWLGEEPSRTLTMGQSVLGDGGDWTKG